MSSWVATHKKCHGKNIAGKHDLLYNMTLAIKIADERREANREGGIQMLYELYNDSVISLDEAAARVGMSKDEFLKTAKAILASDTADNNPF